MLKSLFDILFVLSLIAPIVALIAGAFFLVLPTTTVRRWPRPAPTRL
jgi:hypothetical protein